MGASARRTKGEGAEIPFLVPPKNQEGDKDGKRRSD